MKSLGIAAVVAMFPLPGFTQSERPVTSEQGRAELVTAIEELKRLEAELGRVLRRADGREAMNIMRNNPTLSGAPSVALPMPCRGALGGLAEAFLSATFALNPPAKGKPLGEMSADELRFSDALRPSREMLEISYRKGISSYRSDIQACLELGGATSTKSSLPEQLPRSR
jgi:hypothetical protein